MRFRLRVLAAAGVVLVASWLCLRNTGIENGAEFARLGIDPNSHRVYMHWDTDQRQPFLDYCRAKGVAPAHFSGSIVLSRPGWALDGYEIGLADGKLSHFYKEADPLIQEDIERLRRWNVLQMVKLSRNDWRVYNHADHFVDPSGSFTGDVTLYPNSWFGLQTEVRVVDGRVVSSRRLLYLTLD